METVVADEAGALEGETMIQRRWLGETNRRMPIELHEPLALPSLDQNLVALDRHEQFQSLNPLDRHAQGIIVTKVIDLGDVFALDGCDPHGLPPAVRLGFS